MARGQQGRQPVVPECEKMLDQLKYEIAAEMGLPVGKNYTMNVNAEFATELGAIPTSSMKEDYWGHIASRDAGAVGGAITSRLIRRAQETLLQL